MGPDPIGSRTLAVLNRGDAMHIPYLERGPWLIGPREAGIVCLAVASRTGCRRF